MKLKYSDIPRIKAELLKSQEYLCPICERDLRTLPSREVCLDHNHTTGYVRAVLCRGCNSFEGKAYRLFIRLGLRKAGLSYPRLIHKLAEYSFYEETGYIHPKHKEKKVKK